VKKRFEVEFVVDDVRAFKIAERLYNQFYNPKGAHRLFDA
jgi:hypothetical protein